MVYLDYHAMIFVKRTFAIRFRYLLLSAVALLILCSNRIAIHKEDM